ncbi:MAG TPA: class I SAM-dependent methyltransferase [Rhodocyclaceae bacterium]|nr:class I SAM-dependent methyltransferase [Rhodocyclaceae bacterium]
MSSPADLPPAPPPVPATPLRQLAIQGAAVILVLSMAWPYYVVRNESLPWQQTALFIGGLAFVLATLTRQPLWWRIMHGLFVPLAWLAAQWQIDPGWFLLAFILLLLIYRGAVTGQVPLYLSNQATVDALGGLLREHGNPRFLDLGAGIGSTVVPLARQLPSAQFTGVENAPLTWLAGRLRSLGQTNLAWRYGDFWKVSLADHDVVYAFLSPAPMPRLWQKAKAEMRAGSLFISNSFAIPEREPDYIVEVDCQPPRPLYCYRL